MSNVQIMKTKAEEALAEHFATLADTLPADAVSLEKRRAAMARFEKLGLPHRRIEAWKYTDLRTALTGVSAPATGTVVAVSQGELETALGALASVDAYRAVFVNGRMNNDLSTLPSETDVDIKRVSEVASLDDRLSNESIVALNTAFATDGLKVDVTKDAELDKPLMIVSLRAGDDDLLVTLRHDVSVGENASLTLIEVSASVGDTAGQANSFSSIAVANSGQLDHIKVGAGAGLTDLATWRANLASEAAYRAVQVIPGAPLARNQVFVTFEGENAELDFASAVLGNGTDHIDSTIVVEHLAPGCVSRELFKGVLDGRARGVCQGKVIVQKDAQKTDGKQMAQALMLAEDCEFNSKPELEIYADDVACGHGSTSAELDADLVFYCRSRGIPEDQAKVLLTESFIAEALDKVRNEPQREVLGEVTREWLAANHSQSKT